jgi:hypothetical protein
VDVVLDVAAVEVGEPSVVQSGMSTKKAWAGLAGGHLARKARAAAAISV